MIATYESRLKLQQAMIDQAAAVVKSAEADLSRAQQDYKRYSSPDDERLCQPATLRAGRSRRPQGRGGAGQEPRRTRRRAEPARRAAVAAARGRGQAPASPSQSVAGQERSRQYGDPRADIGSGRQSRRPGRPVRQAGDPAVVAGAIAARLRHGEFQGDAADPDAAGATRRGVGRRLSGSVIEGRIESFAPASGAQFSLLPPDNATGNFTKIVQRVPVRIALPASGPLAGLLRPGLSVTVTIDTRGAPPMTTGSSAQPRPNPA